MSEPTTLVCRGDIQVSLLAAMANRHGLITGATGTGKTVTLQLLAEKFSGMGTAVFLADIKGDLTGLAQTGVTSPKFQARLLDLGLPEPQFMAFPVIRWDVYGQVGHPIRATVAALGPALLARVLGLNSTQAGVLALVFRVAQDEGYTLLDLDDLRVRLVDVTQRAATLQTRYGTMYLLPRWAPSSGPCWGLKSRAGAPFLANLCSRLAT
jgi:DNA helicase HerA-like ATPase